MTLSGVALYLDVGWDLVKGIVKRRLGRLAARRTWGDLSRIAIYEVSVKKGHRYLTLVMDLDSGRVVYVEKGKDHKALKRFFRKLKRAGAELEAIAVDMPNAYRKAIEEYAPDEVDVVDDRFHLVSAMNDTIDAIRRGEQRHLEPTKRYMRRTSSKRSFVASGSRDPSGTLSSFCSTGFWRRRRSATSI
jgi:transposase